MVSVPTKEEYEKENFGKQKSHADQAAVFVSKVHAVYPEFVAAEGQRADEGRRHKKCSRTPKEEQGRFSCLEYSV